MRQSSLMRFCAAGLALVVSGSAWAGAGPVGTGFTYQGLLQQSGAPYTGAADFEFRLFETALGITQIGGLVPVNALAVTDGVFATSLDFGALAFNGEERWLEARVRTPAGSANPFVTLAPRQRISVAPYAAYALNSNTPFAFIGANGVFNGSGRVGIGTNAPVAKLSVTGGGLNVFDDGNQGIHMATDTYSLTTASNEDPVYSYSFATDTHTFSTGGNSRLAINAQGNVGIGTNTPSAMLEVAGSLEVDTTTLVVTPSNDRVGIGTATPQASLHLRVGAVNSPSSMLSNLQIERISSNIVSMMTPAAVSSGIAFGRPGTTATEFQHGSILYNESPLFNAMQFRTGGNVTRMMIDGAGQVGIGTNTPPSLLSVYEPDESATQTSFTQSLAAAGINVITDFTANAYMPGIFWSTQNNNPTKPKAGIYLRDTAAGTAMLFGTSNNYATGITHSTMLVGPSGVGITTLDVAGGSGSIPVLEVAGSDGADIVLQAGAASTNAGDVLIIAGADTGSSVEDAGTVIIAGGPGATSAGVVGGSGGIVEIRGGLGGQGSLQGPTGHVHIQPKSLVTPQGRVGISMPANGLGNAPPDFTLHVDGTAGKPGGGSWTVASDARLKKNIMPLHDSLDRLLTLRGVTFQYSRPDAPLYTPGVQTGMIAQEVERVFPEWIDQTDDGWKTLTFRGFEALTVEALRELRSEKDREIAMLRADKDAEIATLRREIEQLRLAITEIKQASAGVHRR